MVKEYTLSMDDTKQPVVLTGKEAIGAQLVQLLLLKPGTNPLVPNMGVGIKDYRFSPEDDLNELRSLITEQVGLYLPEYQGIPVYVSLDEKCNLRVDFEINGTLYRYDLTGEENTRSLSDFAADI